MSTLELTELDEATREELAPVCDVRHWKGDARVAPEVPEPCDDPAEWVTVLRCCGYIKLMCDEHRRRFGSLNGILHCRRCATIHEDSSPFLSVEPL